MRAGLKSLALIFFIFAFFKLKRQNMKNLILVFITLLPYLLLAQQPNNGALHAQFDQIGKAQSPSSVPTFDTRYEGVLGSRFTIETYNTGEIWLTDGHHYTTQLNYRFDEIENCVQIKYPEGKEILLFNNYVQKCHILNKDTTVIYQKAQIEGEKDPHKLYQVLFEGKNFTLLKFPHRKVLRIDEKTALTIGRLYDQITPLYYYYFKTDGKFFKEIKLKKKDLLKNFPTQKVVLEHLFKTPQYEDAFGESELIKTFQILDKD
jgi:hypothetical protein